MTHSTTQSHPPPPSTRSLWLSLLAGPIVWTIYFIGGYTVSEAACYTDFLEGTLLGFNTLTATLLLMTAGAFLVILYVGWIAYKNWQQLQSQNVSDATANQTDDYGRFMASVGMMLSGLSAFLTLVIGLAVPFLPMCH